MNYLKSTCKIPEKYLANRWEVLVKNLSVKETLPVCKLLEARGCRWQRRVNLRGHLHDLLLYHDVVNLHDRRCHLHLHHDHLDYHDHHHHVYFLLNVVKP